MKAKHFTLSSFLVVALLMAGVFANSCASLKLVSQRPSAASASVVDATSAATEAEGETYEAGKAGDATPKATVDTAEYDAETAATSE